ncbi:MAG: glucose-1-phosphate adenylyltransferase [Peptoniphilaceae bacterium]|nr:glucose-1-phosphate adenylyltransferase [Peptoniphilaceae bacterium]MDD7383535.1 glucose-1-phosphate adenylyltransferase [Peptoniphilaceae bacterium]MDY3738708.1 glucose-1-phosphate adenylyltransferase [Peptoniphilaceae bacterium]
MRNTNKIVAMLLAGGQGSRLKALTKSMAKPAVPFGGKYRIIDFALSNATNSGIRDIGVLTQYKPQLLNEHLGIGQAWDYDRNNGGLRILTPYYTEEGGRWFEGTANAIYENIGYLDSVDPEYVLILSGDHIYKMDYTKLLEIHKSKNAKATIAVMEVPWDEASRFGIMNTDDDGKVVEFEEKPQNPKSNLASMGIYIFNWETLKNLLIEDYKDQNSEYDFGKNIIPKMIKNDLPVYVYTFDGYWKDVGTVKSYWEANLDLIKPDNELNIYDDDWKIYTTSKNLPPHRIGKNADLVDVLVNEADVIDGKIRNSVLFPNVKVENDAEVYNSVILSGSVIKSGVKVYNSVITENQIIDFNVGNEVDDKVYLVSEDGIEEA